MQDQLVRELRAAAAMLEQQAAVRTRLADAARAGWQGPHRPVFDQEHQRLVARARVLAEACRRAAAATASEGTTLTRAGRFS